MVIKELISLTHTCDTYHHEGVVDSGAVWHSVATGGGEGPLQVGVVGIQPVLRPIDTTAAQLEHAAAVKQYTDTHTHNLPHAV